MRLRSVRSVIVAAMPKAIHAQEDKDAARQKAALVAEKLRGMKLDSVAEFVEKSVEETLSHMSFPREHWTRLHTNNSIERIMKEINPAAYPCRGSLPRRKLGPYARRRPSPAYHHDKMGHETLSCHLQSL